METRRYRKPSVHSFKRWVPHTVLPEIRKTGGYPWQVPLMLKMGIVEETD
jgi:prophage antirepressor-like protein